MIGALVDIPGPGAEGVLFAHGTRFGGHALYVKDNRLHYVNNFVGIEEQMIVGTEDVPTGENLILSASFEKEGEEPTCATGRCRSTTARRRSARASIKTQLGAFAIAGTGSTSAATSASRSRTTTPASAPYAFTGGTITGRGGRQRRAVHRPRAAGRRC